MVGIVFLIVLTGVVIGIGLLLYLNSCSHEWETVEEGDIVNIRDKRVGIYYVRKCKHCKKMKANKIYFNEK